jgi:hypothetical protein
VDRRHSSADAPEHRALTLPWTLIPASALPLVWTLGNGIAVAIACVLILTAVASSRGVCSQQR